MKYEVVYTKDYLIKELDDCWHANLKAALTYQITKINEIGGTICKITTITRFNEKTNEYFSKHEIVYKPTPSFIDIAAIITEYVNNPEIKSGTLRNYLKEKGKIHESNSNTSQ